MVHQNQSPNSFLNFVPTDRAQAIFNFFVPNDRAQTIFLFCSHWQDPSYFFYSILTDRAQAIFLFHSTWQGPCYFYSVPTDRARDTSLLRVPFNQRAYPQGSLVSGQHQWTEGQHQRCAGWAVPRDRGCLGGGSSHSTPGCQNWWPPCTAMAARQTMVIYLLISTLVQRFILSKQWTRNIHQRCYSLSTYWYQHLSSASFWVNNGHETSTRDAILYLLIDINTCPALHFKQTMDMKHLPETIFFIYLLISTLVQRFILSKQWSWNIYQRPYFLATYWYQHWSSTSFWVNKGHETSTRDSILYLLTDINTG